jgi:hypothetical protein
MAVRSLPSQEDLRNRLEYNSETGELFWWPRPKSDFRFLRTFNAWHTLNIGRSSPSRGIWTRFLISRDSRASAR